MVTLIGACAEFVRIVLFLTRPLSDKILDVLYHLVMGRTKPLPPIENKILLMSATELAERIRKKQLSCEEVMKAYVDRIRQVQPLINAAVDERLDEAVIDAISVDRFLASDTKSEEEIAKDTPLLGVPFTCKEAIGIKGMSHTHGLFRLKGQKGKRDSDTAALYRKAGAIPTVVTNVPELCMWWESANRIYGMTKNPYDIARTVGGSSGGEGAIITAGGALIGVGNDVAGSIRIPASFCGVYGHKPSRGLISNKVASDFEGESLDKYVSTGPLCRYAEDLPLLVRVLSDNHKNLRIDEKVDLRKVKVYYIEEISSFGMAATPDIKAAIRKAAKHFEEEYGVTPVKLDFDEMRYAFDIWECKLLESGAPPFAAMMADPGSNINLHWELFKSLFQCSNHTWPAIYFGIVDRRDKNKYYYECLEIFEALQKKFDDIFQEDAIVLIPTHAEPPPHYLLTIPKYPNIAYTCIFSILGFASTQIPAGLSSGLPIGIQAISGYFQDHLTIAAALDLDKIFNGWISPCSVSVAEYVEITVHQMKNEQRKYFVEHNLYALRNMLRTV